VPRQKQARTKTPARKRGTPTQTSAMFNILKPENWYPPILAVTGCILVSLAIWGLLHALLSVFGPDPANKDEANPDEKKD
jgi:hypothetical protein